MASIGGYDVTFVEPLDKDLECPVCLLALKEPLQTSCGHLICTTCADRITRIGQFKCPLDNKVSRRRQIFPDVYNARRVLNLKVKCNYHSLGCCWTGELRSIEEHKCVTRCRFSDVGCTNELTRKEVLTHEKSHVTRHLNLLYEAFTESNNMLQEQIAKLQKGKDVATEVAEPSTFTVMWTIENWKEILQVAKKEKSMHILSPPYYVSHPGYKVCIQAYPDGNGRGKGAHLSVFFKVMKGQHDDSLSWPFAKMVTLSVVDQQPGGKNVERTLDLGTGGLLQDLPECFRKPTSDSNEGLGFTTLISHGELCSRCYTRDNLVVIRLDIHNI